MKRALLALMLAGTACGGGGGPTNPAEGQSVATGSYTLTHMDGKPIPVIRAQSSGQRNEYAGGSIVLRDNWSFTQSIIVRNVTLSSGAVHDDNVVRTGTYTILGTASPPAVPQQLTFSVPAGQPHEGDLAHGWSASLSGGVLTYTLGGEAYRYQKN